MKRLFWQVRNAAAISAVISAGVFGQPGPAPTITALSPTAATAGGPNQFTLTLTGANYCGAGEGATIFFNGNGFSANVLSGNSASATIPASAIATQGIVLVTLMEGTDADCNNDGDTSNSFNFTINPPLVLTPASLPGGSVGSPYNQTLTASGGTPPYSNPSPTGTSVPPFTNSAGAVTFNFTPGSATSYNFFVGVTDNGGGSINPAYNFIVRQPVTASASQGTPQTATVATTFPTALQVLVIDGNANPVQGAQVTFTPPVGGATGSFSGSNIVLTDVNGHATAPAFTANATAGSYTVTATVAGTVSTASFNLTNRAVTGPPTSIAVSGGSGQSTQVNMQFGSLLQAIVKDANSNPVQGVAVTFTAPGSGASGTFANAATITTNASGIATAPVLTANTKAGTYNVTAMATGVSGSAAFSLTNTPGQPSNINATAGTPQSTLINTAFSTTLQATLTDNFGNVIPNSPITFSAPVANGSIPTGTFSGMPTAQVLTNASGVATAPTFTANGTAGSYSVRGASGFTDARATFSLTNNGVGPASSITVFAGSPQSATVNTAFATALQAIVKDVNAVPVANVSVTFSAPTTGASGSFATSATVTTNSSGVAVAPRFTANSTMGAYAVTALAAGVTTPASFSLTNTPGPPAMITATGGTPQSALAGTQYAAPLQATVRDSGGNPVPSAQVTFTLPTAPVTAAFISGQPQATSLTNANGVATSPVFTANNATGAYIATANVPGVAALAQFSLNNTPNSSITQPTVPTGLSITTTQLPPGTVGTPYSSGVSATGGVPPYSFSSSGSLPAGLSLISSGIITGTPTLAGTQSFGVQVSDSTGALASRGFTLNVASALIITTASNLPNGTVGQSYAVTFQATGGLAPYSWSSSGGLPAGLTFTSNTTTAALSGTLTAAGSFSFTVSVADSAQRVAVKSFTLSSMQSGSPGTPGTPTGPPGIQVSQMGLTFQGPQGGNQPPPQYLSIVATNGQPLVATITIDGGSTGTPPPPWLKARFVSAITPARLAVQVIPTGLAAGPYTGRVLVSYQGQPTIIVNVSFTVNLTPPELAVAPGFLRFTATSGGAAPAPQALLVSNLGTGGPLSFTATAVSDPWLSVTPVSGTTVVGSGVPLQVAVNTQGLAVGAYLGKITVAGPVGGSVDVPVSLFVSPAGPAITVNPVGVLFNARAGNGLAIPLPVTVLNSGTGTVNWTADLLAGQSWLSLSPASGQSTPTASSQLTATANPTGLAAGAYYALIRISDPQSLNSPQYATAVLNVQPATVGPDADMEPGGLFFTATPGGSAPGPQALKIFVSSDTPAPFQAAASSDDGASWLSIGQPTGTASTTTPGQITVSVNPAGLKTGVYTGDVSVSFSNQTIRTANITLVVLEAGGIAASSSAAPSTGKDRGASCAPSQLSLTSTSLVNAFASPAGWPTPLIVRATDDCGNGAANAQVVATFSNGDPPLNLSRTDPSAALFSGTWAPKNTASQMTVTINGLAPGLATATAQLTGTVGSTTAPQLSPNGTLNNLNPAPGAAVAPGTVAQVFGGSLTPSTAIPGLLPLPTLFNGTSVLVGAYLAPLYSLSDGQLDVQIPTELTPNRQYSILVSSGAAFTLPDTLTTTDVSPGLLNFAQHADFSTISASSPATAGETILLYLVGMGATDQTVASGAASPSSPPANVANTPTVTINGQSAAVSFAGLTPGLVGLYQINVRVPAGTPSGSATVTVTQNSAVSNTVTIPIQ